MTAQLEVYDNTELSSHKNCERRYFFRHVLDLEAEGLAAAPAFGLGWHKAMDVVWGALSKRRDTVGLTNEETVNLTKLAYLAFEAEWTSWGFPGLGELDEEWRDKLKARTPDTALEMISNCIQQREFFIRHECELLAIEQPFVVPLTPDDPNLFYCGRLDKTIRYQGGIYVIDHKTTSMYKKDGYFRSDWVESFSPDSQIEGYSYGAMMKYGDEFKGVYIDGALVHKDVHEGYCLIPVKRAAEHLDAWLWETLQEVKRIRENIERVNDPASLEAPYLPAFRKNPSNCFDFFTPCPYLEICRSVSNPLREVVQHGTPMGFQVNKWSPFDVNQLEKLGLKKDG